MVASWRHRRLRRGLAWVPLLGALAVSPARAWSDQALCTWQALEPLTEIGSLRVRVESLEHFLAAQAPQLERVLAEHEAWAREHLEPYDPRPEALALQAPGAAGGGQATEGSELAVSDVIATAAQEPDFGLDLGLYADSGTARGREAFDAASVPDAQLERSFPQRFTGDPPSRPATRPRRSTCSPSRATTAPSSRSGWQLAALLRRLGLRTRAIVHEVRGSPATPPTQR